MKNPRCGGCPQCCKQCVFDSEGEKSTGQETIVQTAAEYDCKKGFGDIVSDPLKGIGQTRNGRVHFLSKKGLAFLQSTGNPILQFTGATAGA
jgi:hypothetical protein